MLVGRLKTAFYPYEKWQCWKTENEITKQKPSQRTCNIQVDNTK